MVENRVDKNIVGYHLNQNEVNIINLTFLASCVSGLVPAKSVNQLFMELCDLAVTSQKLSFWLTCGLRFPVSGKVL